MNTNYGCQQKGFKQPEVTRRAFSYIAEHHPHEKDGSIIKLRLICKNLRMR
jgi:hypothetical protein